MVHELVFRVSKESKSHLEAIKEIIETHVSDGNIQIISYSSNGLCEESKNYRKCKSKESLTKSV